MRRRPKNRRAGWVTSRTNIQPGATRPEEPPVGRYSVAKFSSFVNDPNAVEIQHGLQMKSGALHQFGQQVTRVAPLVAMNLIERA